MNYRQIATAALFALTAAAFIYAAVWLFHLTEGAADLAIIIGRAAGVFAIIVWFFALLLIGFALLCLWAAVKVFWKLSPVARPPASPPSRTQREPTPKHRKAWIYAVAALLLVAAVPVLTFVSSFAHPDVQTLRSLDHKRYVSAAVWSPDGNTSRPSARRLPAAQSGMSKAERASLSSQSPATLATAFFTRLTGSTSSPPPLPVSNEPPPSSGMPPPVRKCATFPARFPISTSWTTAPIALR